MSTLDSLDSLVTSLKTVDNAHATTHHTPSTWVELIVEDRLIGSEIRRRIVDHGCEIVDIVIVDDQAVVVHVEAADWCSHFKRLVAMLLEAAFDIIASDTE